MQNQTSTGDTVTTRARGGRADKRQAILAGALTVFARDGYSRASIDAISASAGVSTRTIYNHFEDKAQLFEAVIQDSAARAAEAQIALIERHLNKIIDLETDLIEFGRDWTAPMPAYADHFALVRQINAELGHIPRAAIDAWQATGPLRVRHELALRIAKFADRGLLRVADPERAALHLLLLISSDVPAYEGDVLTEEQADEMVTSGVRAFLHGYGTAA
ncbi:TetR/AcrR family transcriptional regulator [Nonomuraea candida]|uniref:TetR/AcrR family transcriptional regulator n=1 Tax=Nonomuraea candida TaxID=359159 RepID=UPI000694B645|nr:TetR/AcrR family transcriptional regulator [Nonomuraea candida]